jgi:methionyl-tRNA synthetase
METGKVVEWTVEENYKFKLSAFAEKLLEWLEKNPDGTLCAQWESRVSREHMSTNMELTGTQSPR